MNNLLKVPTKESRALQLLKQLIPPASVVHSFLLFDGNLEAGLAKDERYVVAHTNKYVIYEFWKCVQEDPDRLAKIVEHFQPIEDVNIFHLLQENWARYPDPFMRSAIFLLLNRYSADGQISHGIFNAEAYRPTHLVNLRRTRLPNVHFALDKGDDYLENMSNTHGTCDYIFLPVFSYSLNLLEEGRAQGLEETKVHHKKLKQWVDTTDQKVVLLYHNISAVTYLYEGYNMYFVDQWGRPVESRENATEILIANF